MRNKHICHAFAQSGEHRVVNTASFSEKFQFSAADGSQCVCWSWANRADRSTMGCNLRVASISHGVSSPWRNFVNCHLRRCLQTMQHKSKLKDSLLG